MIRVNGRTIEIARYPNGEMRIDPAQFAGIYELSGETEVIQFRYEKDSDLLALLFVKIHLDDWRTPRARATVRSTLLIDYMPYSRMDRSEGGAVFTLRYVADLINAMQFDRVCVLDAHSEATSILLNRSVVRSAAYDLLTKAMLAADFDSDRDYIVYPDAGAAKRYRSLTQGRHLICHKKRDFATGRIESLDLLEAPEYTGWTAIILDDLCSYGGTFVMAAKRLRQAGAKRVYLCVTHCEDSIYAGPLFTGHSEVDGIYTTDSLLTQPDPTGLIHIIPTDQIWQNPEVVW